MTSQVRNAQQEAADLLGPEIFGHVLEPSPPTNTDEKWFADDPLAPVEGPNLVPHGIERPAGTSWSTWLEENEEHRAWVEARWLGGNRSLGLSTDGSSLETIAVTRVALHRLAAYVIAPARHQANGKFGLRWTLGGFGTPFFGADRQVRVEGTQLVDQRGAEIRSTPITTLQAAADFLDSAVDPDTAAEGDSPAMGDVNETLPIDPAAADFLGNWYGMAFAALEQLRSDSASVDPSRPQLWPGHFDPAIEVGDEDHRGSYGASPGDPAIPEPYLYVSSWWPDRLDVDWTDPAWNAPSFTGAILRLSDFGPGDPATIAANFYTTTRDRLTK